MGRPRHDRVHDSVCLFFSKIRTKPIKQQQSSGGVQAGTQGLQEHTRSTAANTEDSLHRMCSFLIRYGTVYQTTARQRLIY